MKKILLACSLIASSIFFASAQSGINVNIGQVCRTSGTEVICLNPSTGQWVVRNANGTGASGNVNTGAVSGVGTIGGVRIGGSGVFGTGNGTVVGGVGTAGNFSGPLGLLALAQLFVSRSVPLLIGLAVLAFFWFLVEFIWKGKDSPDHYKKSRTGMIWSLVAIFVMVSVWGIIMFIGGVLGIGQGGSMSGFKLPGER